MDRHLVAVEFDGAILGTQSWRRMLHSIFDAAARHMEIRSSLRLEPVPQREEILRAFRSFTKLTRLRVKLRIPNPELSRWTKQLQNDMENGGIREYLQDMKNPGGLNRDDAALPYASVSLAAAGYKQGDVVMEGVRNGRRDRVKTGRRAARGAVDSLRNFARGMLVSPPADPKKAIRAIIKEMDRIAEPPQDTKE
jgi:hypothetical protein